jgi:hypothetical protein
VSEGRTRSPGSSFNPKDAEAFAGRLMGALNDGAYAWRMFLNADGDAVMREILEFLRRR